MSTIIENNIIKNIMMCKFDEAQALLKEFSYDELENLLLKIGYDYGQSMIIYAFVCHLINQEELVNYHLIAESILCGPLCYIEGAYNIALYHNKKVLGIESDNIKAMTMMLFYNTLSAPLVSDDEANEYVKKIIEIEPQNITALQFMKSRQ